MRSLRGATIFVASAALVTAACARDAGGPTSAPGGAEFGGTLSVVVGAIGSIDPASAYEPNGELVARTMCDTLLQADPVTGELKPGLADSWLVSDDGVRITVRISRRARFSDGSKVDASDVVRSLTRAASPELAS